MLWNNWIISKPNLGKKIKKFRLYKYLCLFLKIATGDLWFLLRLGLLPSLIFLLLLMSKGDIFLLLIWSQNIWFQDRCSWIFPKNSTFLMTIATLKPHKLSTRSRSTKMKSSTQKCSKSHKLVSVGYYDLSKTLGELLKYWSVLLFIEKYYIFVNT